MTSQGKNENEDEKQEKMSSIFELSISKPAYVAVFLKTCEKKFDLFFKTFLTNQGKKNEDEKIWENDFKFWILHIKIKLCDSFYENLRKIFWRFCKTFFTNWGNNEDENEKIRENYLELSISKLGYVIVLMKIWEKSLRPIWWDIFD